MDYSKKIANYYSEFRIEIDDRAESVSIKIKRAREDLVFNYIVIGEKEMIEGQIPNSVEEIINSIKKQIFGLPQIQVSIPKLVSAMM